MQGMQPTQISTMVPNQMGMNQPNQMGMMQPNQMGMMQPNQMGMMQPNQMGMMQPNQMGMMQPNPMPTPSPNPMPSPSPNPKPQPPAPKNMCINFLFNGETKIGVQGNDSMTIEKLIKNFRVKLCNNDIKIDKYIIHPSGKELNPNSQETLAQNGISGNIEIIANSKN